MANAMNYLVNLCTQFSCIVLEDESRIHRHQSRHIHDFTPTYTIFLRLHLNKFILFNTKCTKTLVFLQLIDETQLSLHNSCFFVDFAKSQEPNSHQGNPYFTWIAKNYACEQICSIKKYKWKIITMQRVQKKKKSRPIRPKCVFENDLI